MSPGPFAPHAFPRRDLAGAACAGLLLAWLVAAAPDAPLPRTAAELPAFPALVWFPATTTPLLWLHGLHP